MKDGQVELMVHRRLLHDDGRGLGEPLREPGSSGDGIVSRGVHHVFVTSREDGSVQHRMHGESMMAPSVVR